MGETEMARALAECLEAAKQGPEALREALGRYPVEWQRELAQLVQLAISIPAAGEESTPSAGWRARTRRRLLEGLEGQEETQAAGA